VCYVKFETEYRPKRTEKSYFHLKLDLSERKSSVSINQLFKVLSLGANAHPVASLGGERWGRTAPGDTLQGVTPEGKKICGQIYKE